ncbi:MAG: hypothetical protein HAW67_03420 [Endozoicomonadaceae bacterium]|nr:hypothetical protein [Endozoicomonadaceae bacterium]
MDNQTIAYIFFGGFLLVSLLILWDGERFLQKTYCKNEPSESESPSLLNMFDEIDKANGVK